MTTPNSGRLLLHAAIRERIGALVLWVPRVSLHPVPADAVPARCALELLPQVDVLDGLLVGGAPAAPLPVGQPFADTFLDVLRVGVDLYGAGVLERFQRPDHRGQLHAVVGGVLLSSEDLLLASSVSEDRAPAPGAGIALAGAVGVDLNHLQLRSRFSTCNPFSLCVTGARAFLGMRLSRQFGVTNRMPATRLTARTTYTLPQIGHQRSPAFSIKPKRSSQRPWLNGGA